MDRNVPEEAIVLRHHDIPGLLSGLIGGIGVGLMSDTVAAASGLVLCFVPPMTQEVPLWPVTTESLRSEPRIRAFVDFPAGYMTQGRYRMTPVQVPLPRRDPTELPQQQAKHSGARRDGKAVLAMRDETPVRLGLAQTRGARTEVRQQFGAGPRPVRRWPEVRGSIPRFIRRHPKAR